MAAKENSAAQTNALAGDPHNQRLEFFHVPSGKCVWFKAFITQYEDIYTSQWQPEQVYGRMDPLMTFQNTTRQISIGFDVVAEGEADAIENLAKFSLLTQMLYPSYESGGATTIKASPYFKLKFMNWAVDAEWYEGLLGTVNGFNFAPKLDMGVFQGGRTGLDIFPKVISVAFQFTVLHQHSMGWQNKTFMGKDFPYGVPVVGGECSDDNDNDGNANPPDGGAAQSTTPEGNGAARRANNASGDVTGNTPSRRAIARGAPEANPAGAQAVATITTPGGGTSMTEAPVNTKLIHGPRPPSSFTPLIDPNSATLVDPYTLISSGNTAAGQKYNRNLQSPTPDSTLRPRRTPIKPRGT